MSFGQNIQIAHKQWVRYLRWGGQDFLLVVSWLPFSFICVWKRIKRKHSFRSITNQMRIPFSRISLSTAKVWQIHGLTLTAIPNHILLCLPSIVVDEKSDTHFSDFFAVGPASEAMR